VVRRREFLTLLAGTVVAWPLAGRAQQPTMPVIGFLSSVSPEQFVSMVAAFRQGLNETGYVEGQNVAIEFRWAEGQYDRLPAMAANLLERQVALIVASGGDTPALAAKAATSTIPIVFTGSDFPVKIGLVASLNRPGGNVTGISLFTSELEAKKLGLLRELVPKAHLIAMLVNPNNPSAESDTRDVLMAASAVGQQIHILRANNERDIDAAFATLVQQRTDALLVAHDPAWRAASATIWSRRLKKNVGIHSLPAHVRRLPPSP
jgi:putative tryptophan/tyrosine transport system substrate-binding protein